MIEQMSAGVSTLQVYTSPHATLELDPQPALLALIGKATQSIYMGIYSFSLPQIAQAIIAKHQAGVMVRVAGDTGEVSLTSQYPALKAAGVDVHVWGTKYLLQHMKVIVVDGKYVAWGSYNFSVSAEQSNFEVMTITHNVKLAQVFTAQIQKAYDKGVPL